MPVAGTFVRQWKNMQDALKYAGNMSDAEYQQYYQKNFTPAYTPTTKTATGTGTSSNGTLAGAPPQSGSGPYGAVPTVPDPTKSMADYMAGWQSNLPAYTQLLKSINDAANQQAKANLEANLPGYGANQAALSSNINDLLSGKISQSTINNMATAAAERGIVTGGGPNANAAYLRALGLTTEGLKAQGAQQFAQQIAQTPIGKSIDWATFTSLANEQQQWEYLASVLRASPDPAAAAALNMAMAQAGQRAGYGAGGGVSNPSIGRGQAAASNWLANLTNSLWSGSGGGSSMSPVDSIIQKYMPSAGINAPSSSPMPIQGRSDQLNYAPTYDPGLAPGYDPFQQAESPSLDLPYADEFYNGWTPDAGYDPYADWEMAYLFGG